MAKNKGLGRGLDALFSDNQIEESSDKGTMEISISQIDPNSSQPRKSFDNSSLSELADSISANGVLQPILVRATDDGRYEIIAGERRFRASKLAGKKTIPALIINATDFDAAKYALIENIQREDLNPYEEAMSYSTLMKEYNLNQEEIASQVGKSRPAVANALRLLDLPDEIAKLLVDGKLTAGHARTLLGLKDRALMPILAERCIKRNLSVRELEQAVKSANKAAEDETVDSSVVKVAKVNYYQSLEQKFTEATGRRCRISEKKNNKVFTVEYHDNDDLCELIKKLAGDEVLNDF